MAVGASAREKRLLGGFCPSYDPEREAHQMKILAPRERARFLGEYGRVPEATLLLKHIPGGLLAPPRLLKPRLFAVALAQLVLSPFAAPLSWVPSPRL